MTRADALRGFAALEPLRAAQEARIEQLRMDGAAGRLKGIGGAAIARQSRPVETIQAGVVLVEMQDADPLAAFGLSRREHDAGMRLLELWQAAMPVTLLPGGYNSVSGHGGQRNLTPEEEARASNAWQTYRRAMDEVRARAGVPYEVALRCGVILGDKAHAGYVREALNCLAGHWGMR